MSCLYCQTEKIMARGMCGRHYKLWYRDRPLDQPPRAEAILPKSHPVYRAWTNMKTRCDNSKSTQWKWYGARGIHYSEVWEKFENFYADMFDSWGPGLMLDRRDNSKGYDSDNCRWVTPKVSSNNRRARGTS